MSLTALLPAAPVRFQGYDATLDGMSSCRVVNENTDMELTAGGKAHCLKVRIYVVTGYEGWSGGCRAVKSLGTPIWVRAARVTR